MKTLTKYKAQFAAAHLVHHAHPKAAGLALCGAKLSCGLYKATTEPVNCDGCMYTLAYIQLVMPIMIV